MSAKPKTFGRRFVDISQKARGRVPLCYEFQIIPYFVGEIPPGHERVMFVWERGNKLYVTDAEAVNPKTRAVFWKQYLRQVITVYKAPTGMVKKEYTFKVQSVRHNSATGEQERTTIGKIHVDLSLYCTGQTDPQPQEVFLHLKPHGRLKLSVKATWLKDAHIDADTMTELSSAVDEEYIEEKGQYLDDEPYNEQDLSGFDNGDDGTSETSSGGRRHRSSGRSRRKAGSEGAAEEGGGEGGVEAGGEEGAASSSSGQRRSSRKAGGSGRGKSGRSRGRGAGEDPGDPNEMRRIQEVDNEGTAEADEYDRMVAEVNAQVRTEVSQPQQPSTCCCCFPRKPAVVVVGDVQESASLLKKPGAGTSQNRQ